MDIWKALQPRWFASVGVIFLALCISFAVMAYNGSLVSPLWWPVLLTVCILSFAASIVIEVMKG